MKYLIIEPDPFYHGTALAKIRKQMERERSKHNAGPVYIEPVMALLFRGLYAVWHMGLRCIFWTLYKVDAEFRALADI